MRCLRSGHLTAASALTVTGDHGPLPDLATRERLLMADEAAWAAITGRRASTAKPWRLISTQVT